MRGTSAALGASGTSSRATTGGTPSVEIDTWLSPRIAWIRNQMPVMEMTAMNQIDQMPERRWKSPQKMRAPWPTRRRGLKKPFQNFL